MNALDTPRAQRRRSPRLLVAVATVTIAATTAADGRIVINHDEWTLSSSGFGSPNDPALFAQNVVAWLVGGGQADVLIYSSNFGLTGTQFTQALQAAGHVVTTSTADLTLPAAQAYDAIFICASTVNANVLIDYVGGGGGVYICAGTSVNFESTQYNPFLSAYGLSFQSSLNGLNGNQAIGSSHPIFAGVDSLFHNNGNFVLDLDAGDPRNEVLVSVAAGGLYAVYDGASSCAADFNGDGMVDGADLGSLLGQWGGPGSADLDGSGSVDGADLGLLLGAWGPC